MSFWIPIVMIGIGWIGFTVLVWMAAISMWRDLIKLWKMRRDANKRL